MMIVIQDFPSVAVLRGWLHDKRFRCRDQSAFQKWLRGYLSDGREITARGRTYYFEDCIHLMAGN